MLSADSLFLFNLGISEAGCCVDFLLSQWELALSY